MELSQEDVKKIAHLSRLHLSATEIEKFQGELSVILEYVQQLQEVDTDGIEPTSQVTGLLNVVRPDEVDYNYSREEILASAIESAEDHIKVKNVF